MNLMLFKALSDAFGPSGYEEDVLRYDLGKQGYA